MKRRPGNLMRIVLLITIALALLGFRSGPMDDRFAIDDDETVGYMSIDIYAHGQTHSHNDDTYLTWHEASAILPITYKDFHGTGKYWVFGKRLYTVFDTHSIVGVPRIGRYSGTWPIAWDVSAFLNPDCSVQFIIDESWYPGTEIVCAPIVGCQVEFTEAEKFKHAGTMKIPSGEGMGVIPWQNAGGKLVIVINSMYIGEDGDICEYNYGGDDDLIVPGPE